MLKSQSSIKQEVRCAPGRFWLVLTSVANPVLNASDAYACLQEIPFDATRGANFIKEVRKHVEFQSDLAILKSMFVLDQLGKRTDLGRSSGRLQTLGCHAGFVRY